MLNDCPSREGKAPEARMPRGLGRKAEGGSGIIGGLGGAGRPGIWRMQIFVSVGGIDASVMGLAADAGGNRSDGERGT